MKKVLTTLLLVASLSGLSFAAEARDSTLRSEVKSISIFGNTVHPSLMQRWRRQRRRRVRRFVRRHRNNGRWDNRGQNNGRWNNRRRRNRRSGGHDVH